MANSFICGEKSAAARNIAGPGTAVRRNYAPPPPHSLLAPGAGALVRRALVIHGAGMEHHPALQHVRSGAARGHSHLQTS